MIEDVSLMVASDAGHLAPVRAWRLTGHGGGPRVHLQAGIHADEVAGMLVLHRLLPRLAEAHASGRLRGTVTIVPQANPLGIAQFHGGRLLGRFHEATHRNFNRHFIESAARQQPATTFAAWQKAILKLACDARIVLDLHTDAEALPYLYVHQGFWPEARDLAASLGAEFVILWDEDKDGAFEGAMLAHWMEEGACAGRLVTTVELRGQSDVRDALAAQDAQGIYAFLCARGVIEGPAGQGERSGEWSGEVVAIGNMETLFAPVSGVLVYERELGDRLAEGEPVARIIARPGEPDSEHVLRAPQAGRLVTRSRDRLVAQGDVVVKLTGSRPSAGWAGGFLDP